ncbi:putative glycosyltransferase [Citricoccus zhacaiensis]|uniref:Glycosyltransferase n=1 Tax=Citricoccus zhacaiensis TaxID=489142 RepID=A0ABQ2M9Q6_9MICC|nr:mycofactocin biosynthesis glycosyltransferase MftF [Citricoccus zhacaiensis]GGO48452.1 putative glycosyltransferase [Citricoccus zhacaiensis]
MTAIARTQGSYTRRHGELVFGGSPWGLARLSAPARPFARKVLRRGAGAVEPVDDVERATARLLVDRGLALPVHPPRRPRPDEVEVIVPVHGSAVPLTRLLPAVHGHRVTVVDDASSATDAREIERVCAAHGVRLVVLPENVGPGGARNAGLAASTDSAEGPADFVAFLDADTVPTEYWLDVLFPHVDDPTVAVAAPRVRGSVTGAGPGTVLERFESRRGGLDLGPQARRVAPGGQIGYVPTAALLVRRAALPDPPFEPGLRVGEDVDLIWRLVAAGHTVRYVPSAEVHHEVRAGLAGWCQRHTAYGTSAVPLEDRHPGRLAPATWGWPGLAVLAGSLVAVGGRGPVRALGVAGAVGGSAVQLGASVRRFHRRGLPVSGGAEVAVLGLRSEVTAVGNALRREWWPLGALALAVSMVCAAPVSRARRVARAVVVLALAPTVPDTVQAARHWVQDRLSHDGPAHDAGAALDPARHLALRLVADAAYGTGVLRAAVRSRRWAVLRPRLRQSGA